MGGVLVSSLLLIVIISVHPGEARVQIVEPLTSALTVRLGQRLTLVCRHAHKSPLRWYFNGRPVTSGQLMRLTPSSGDWGTQTVLTVRSTSYNTRGQYQCSNQQDYYDYDYRRVDVSANAPIYIGRRVDIVQPNSNTTSVGEGGALSLKCEGGASTQLTWLHDEQTVTPDTRVIITSALNTSRNVMTSTLTVMNMEAEDEGLYVCQDKGSYQNGDVVNVTVIKANLSQEVRITNPVGKRAIFTKGRILEAKCRGNESRLLEWRHNSQPVVPNSRVIVTKTRLGLDEMVETQLTVVEVGPEDAGEYMCRDRADLLQKDTFMAVVLTPRKDAHVSITSPFLNETTVAAGGAVTVTCSVSALNTGLRWKHNGLPLTKGPHVDVMTSRHRENRTVTSVLTLVNVTLMDTGRYTCQDVRDDLNYQELEISLTEESTGIEPTLFIEEPPSSYISVVPGEYLVIKCVGNEDTSVIWRHNGRIFDPRDRVGYVLTSLMDVRRHTVASVIAIFSITKNDSGVFTCEDKSDYRNSASVGIRVPNPVNITTGDMLLYLGDPLRLPCVADSGTDLEWFRDGQLVNSTTEGVSVFVKRNALLGIVTSVLRYNTIANHSGEYTCQDSYFTNNQMTISVIYDERKEKPELQITTPRTTISKEGSKLIIRCKTSAGVVPYWTKNDIEVTTGSDVFVMTTMMTSGEQWSSMIVSPLTLLSSGVYECRDRRGRAKTARSFVVVQPRK